MVNWHPLGTIWHPLEGPGMYINISIFRMNILQPPPKELSTPPLAPLQTPPCRTLPSWIWLRSRPPGGTIPGKDGNFPPAKPSEKNAFCGPKTFPFFVFGGVWKNAKKFFQNALLGFFVGAWSYWSWNSYIFRVYEDDSNIFIVWKFEGGSF